MANGQSSRLLMGSLPHMETKESAERASTISYPQRNSTDDTVSIT